MKAAPIGNAHAGDIALRHPPKPDELELLTKRSLEKMGVSPFPRRPERVRVSAMRRGGGSGCAAAEAFMLLKEIR